MQTQTNQNKSSTDRKRKISTAQIVIVFVLKFFIFSRRVCQSIFWPEIGDVLQQAQ